MKLVENDRGLNSKVQIRGRFSVSSQSTASVNEITSRLNVQRRNIIRLWPI